MSFDEYVFSVGFIQKTAKGDLFIKGNHRIPLQKQRGKTLEHSRKQTTEGLKRPRKWIGWPSP
jgi:hypothetical protein